MTKYSNRCRPLQWSRLGCLLCCVLGLAALSGCKLYRVEPLGPLHVPAKGIVYVLPQTELVMDVEIERTVLSLGRFARFAREFGMTPNPFYECPDGKAAKRETNWRYACTPKLLNAEVSAVGVPDPDMRFHVTILSERKAVDRSVDFTFLDDARLTKADAVVHDRSAEIAVQVISKTLEVAATVASTMFGLPSSPVSALEVGPKKDYPLPSGHPCEKQLEAKKKKNVRKKPEREAKWPGTEEGRACVSYRRLLQLTAHRESVISTLKTNPTEAAAKAAVALLAVLDEEMRSTEALFSVTQTTTTRTVRRTFIPEIARRSRTYRVTDQGELVIDEARGQLKLTVQLDAMGPPVPGREVSTERCGTTSGNGLIYRLPASGTASVVSGARILASERVTLPQFGRLASLPGCFRKNKTTLNVALSPNTGMLEKILMKEEAVPSDDAMQKNLEAIGTASDKLAKAVGAQLEVEEEEDAELEALKRQKERLETQKEMEEIRRQIDCLRETGKPCPDDED